jgi:cleavage and polyadenylation specificity factor subunit 3
MASVGDDEPVDPSDEFSFIGLGGCQEVGRSCHIIQYKGKTIMVYFYLATFDQILD